MGGFFGVASKTGCTLELFYGVDYHSHLGTRRGGMATCGERGFQRAIHNIENSPFRTKFERDVDEMEGNPGNRMYLRLRAAAAVGAVAPPEASPSQQLEKSTTWMSC